MDYKSLTMEIAVDDGFNCPYCGGKIGRLNVGFAKYIPDGQRIFFGYGGCCDAADRIAFEMPADTAFGYATMPAVLDTMREKLDKARGCV